MNDSKEEPSSKPLELLSEVANQFKEHNDLGRLIIDLQRKIINHSEALLEHTEPKTILESRFTPAQEAYNKGFLSCGAMANISAKVLRVLGYEARLVHGEVPESVDHAWITVRNSETGEWIQYDLTRKGAQVGGKHIVIAICDSWEEIRDRIEEDHHTLYEGR